MSYSIIFETKIVKLPDGRIIHFNRSGCNNDNEGRNKDDFTAKIYENEQAFIKYAEKFRQDYDGGFELKIGNRSASYNDYYEHLLRMCKRGKTLEQFAETFFFKGFYVDSVEVYEPERATLTAKEFDNKFYDYLYGGKSLRYRQNYITLFIDEIDKILNRLESNQPIRFEISKKWRKI